MTSVLTAALPRPRNAFAAPTSQALEAPVSTRRQLKQPPPYGQREGFIPRNEEDFADGGAFPEIHLAQYPLGMGKKNAAGGSNALSIQLDSTGKVKYETILGHGKDKIVHSTALALTEKVVDEEELARPSEEEEAEATMRTRAALEKIVNTKIVAARPAQPGEKQGEPTYIRYTPAGGGVAAASGHNSGAKQRIIRMVEMPKDPMEPPKFKHKKVPAGPPSPPAPVVHSPPRKITVADQQAWKIPPCISNWKNAKGYTIPLDKRLAADGRALQEVQINDSFAKLSEALYIAERRAREEVARRAAIARQISINEKTEQEEKLRHLAEEARKGKAAEMELEEALDEEELEKKQERDELRYERKRERDRKRHLDNYQGKKKPRTDEERDVSEKVALGEAPSTSVDTMFDARLFNQSQGMDSGFADDEAYNVYDKPLFQGSSANFLYRPKKDADSDVYGDDDEDAEKQDTKRFKPNRDFSGVDRAGRAEPRRAPVEFEKEEDPFGLDEFLTEAKETQKKKNPLDHIGSSNTMHAAGGGTRDTMSNRGNIQFESKGTASESVAKPSSPSSSRWERDSDRSRDRDRDDRRDRDHDRRDRDRDDRRERDRDRDRDRGRDDRRDRDRDYDRRRR